MYYPLLKDYERLKMLEIPENGILDIVLDTDAFNEIDDQFAIMYALRSKERINLRALYAAPFSRSAHINEEMFACSGSVEAGEGMELSYQEIIRIMKIINVNTDGFVFRGVDRFMESETLPVKNSAAEDLINKANNYSSERPLYVVAIGAPTNIASAIVMNPEIIRKIVVIWQGGNVPSWPHTDDYNLKQDIYASRVLLNSGVPLIQVPAMGGTDALLTTGYELEHYLADGGEVARYLLENVKQFISRQKDNYAYAKEIWDIGTISLLINRSWMPSYIIHSPVLTDGLLWAHDPRRHLIKTVYYVDRNNIMGDMLKKIHNI